MAEPNSKERIASSPITWSSSHYITFQLWGQRGEHAAAGQKKPRADLPGAIDAAQNHL